MVSSTRLGNAQAFAIATVAFPVEQHVRRVNVERGQTERNTLGFGGCDRAMTEPVGSHRAVGWGSWKARKSQSPARSPSRYRRYCGGARVSARAAHRSKDEAEVRPNRQASKRPTKSTEGQRPTEGQRATEGSGAIFVRARRRRAADRTTYRVGDWIQRTGSCARGCNRSQLSAYSRRGQTRCIEA